MVRSMYAGVSGLRTHQSRMDVIGNNIANVNTYGYKSSRATFRDIYYENLSAASGPTGIQGGQNPSAVGYGTQLASVDLMMGRSTFTMTDSSMDMAIDGDGFFQVMDANENVYYTRAGMLNFDAAGNLVDMQGNFVLGVNGDPTGAAPASEKIVAPDEVTGISIVPNGIITGLDANGDEIFIGRIDLAIFVNAAGLNQAGSSMYSESANSGAPRLETPGTGGTGGLVGGSLELSNVDLSKEFSDMITTQRGYQANSRMITVSDTMLEELINLKR